MIRPTGRCGGPGNPRRINGPGPGVDRDLGCRPGGSGLWARAGTGLDAVECRFGVCRCRRWIRGSRSATLVDPRTASLDGRPGRSPLWAMGPFRCAGLGACFAAVRCPGYGNGDRIASRGPAGPSPPLDGCRHLVVDVAPGPGRNHRVWDPPDVGGGHLRPQHRDSPNPALVATTGGVHLADRQPDAGIGAGQDPQLRTRPPDFEAATTSGTRKISP